MTEPTRARSVLDAWREQGADRLDPMRFRIMDALEQRAAQHEGETRRLLDERLATLLDAYAADLAQAAPVADVAEEDAVRQPFAELIDQLASAAALRASKASRDVAVVESARPEMALLGEFRKIWTSVRTESQLRQSMEQAPENAGPLNSRALVHRAIALMRDTSPGYLQHFLAYIDDLAWIEQLSVNRAPAAREAAPSAPTRKRRARTRAE